MVAVLAACGAGQSGNSSAKPLETLTVALATPVVSGSQVPLGVELGYFKDEGLDIKTQNGLGGNLVNTVVAGQADIGFFSMVGLSLPAQKGKPTTVFYGGIGGGLASMLVGRPGINSIADLKAKNGNCTIAGLTPGSSNYGYAAFYNQSLGLNCKLVSFSNDTEEVGAVVAGRTDAAGGTADDYTALIPQNKVNVLVDGRDPATRQKYLGAPIVEVGYFGLTDNLTKKKDAITRFVRALHRTDQAIRTMTPEKLATALHQHPDFQTTDVANLTTQFTNDRQYFSPYDGYIAQTEWDLALLRMQQWGINGFNPSDPAFAYKDRVDMKYYVAAIGQPKAQ